jgi:hypothetical protein
MAALGETSAIGPLDDGDTGRRERLRQLTAELRVSFAGGRRRADAGSEAARAAAFLASFRPRTLGGITSR